jgi:tetratricopeptide (TPR) repeat protein
VGFVAGLMKKALYFVSSPELPRNEDIYVFRQWSHLLSIGVWRVGPFGFPFALLFPLAAIGALVHRRRIGAHAWMLLVMFPAGVVLVFVSSRYRVPLVPLLAVLGAAGAAACIERWRRRDRDGLARAGVIAAIALAVTCWPVHPSVWRTNYEAELYRMVGVEAYREARDRDAIAPLERALAIDPDHADAHYDLAVVLRRLGRFDEARRHLRAAVRARPDSTRARRALAALQ